MSGSEFTTPNILVAGADSIWDDFVHQEDSVIEQERANAIADFERQTQRQMTADETAQMEDVRNVGERLDITSSR